MLTRVVGKQADKDTLKAASNLPSANTAAVITLPAVAGKNNCVHSIQWSYSVAPTGGKLTVTVNSVSKWEVDITASGPGGFSFPIVGGVNQAVVITLASGTGSCVGKLNAQYTIEVDAAL